MSYIDETYGKQLEEALRGLVSRPALGQPWFGFHASEVPAGVLLFTATTHSRVLYADFWKYIQDKNLVKTEEEWQSIYNEQGWCPFYSDGDGIDTFRMPSAPLYLHGTGILSEAGQYVEAGLPNIVGIMDANGAHGLYGEPGLHEAFYKSSIAYRNVGLNSGSATLSTMNFDASRSNPIYGKSDTVTPETSKMLFGVWAIAAPQKPIPDATIEGIISELNIASNNASEAKNGLNGVIRFVNDKAPDAEGKVDIAEFASGLGMPSDRWQELSFGATNTVYTAPANGWFTILATSTSTAAYLGFFTLNNGCTSLSFVNANGRNIRVLFPAKKGDNVQLLYSAINTPTAFRFVYAEGAK